MLFSPYLITQQNSALLSTLCWSEAVLVFLLLYHIIQLYQLIPCFQQPPPPNHTRHMCVESCSFIRDQALVNGLLYSSKLRLLSIPVSPIEIEYKP